MGRGNACGGGLPWVAWLAVLALALAPTATAEASSRPVRRALAAGFDVSLGVPSGFVAGPVVGLDAVLQPVGPLSITAGGETNGATWAVHGELQVNLLTFFTADAWTPFVRGGVAHLRYTAFADTLLDTLAPGARDDLQQVGTDLRFDGMRLNLATVSAGIDCLSTGGFHFQLAVGRAFLLGDSRGTDDAEGVVLTDYQSWTFEMTMGWLFW